MELIFAVVAVLSVIALLTTIGFLVFLWIVFSKKKENLQKTSIVGLTISFAFFLITGCAGVITAANLPNEEVKTQTTSSNTKETDSKSQKSSNKENLVKINKTSNAVGPIKVHVDSIKYEKVVNDESNYTDAEYNLEGNPKSDLNHEYYRAKIALKFENTSNKHIDLSFGNRTYIVDDGTSFPTQSGANGSAFESSIAKIAPHASLSETIILISNKKFTANHLKVTFEDICENGETTLSEGGTAEIK